MSRFQASEGQIVEYWEEPMFADGWTKTAKGRVVKLSEDTKVHRRTFPAGHLVVRVVYLDGSLSTTVWPTFDDGTLPNGWVPEGIDFSNGFVR